MRKRTRARELALQFLYSIDAKPDPAPGDCDAFLAMQTRDERIAGFARDLIRGCLEHRERIDQEIRAVAARWDIDRIATIDRNVLRIATYELLLRRDIPPRVTLNEAIDLAKRFSTERSGGFVNGLLDQIRMRTTRAIDDRAAPPPVAIEPEGDTDESSDEDDEPAVLE